MTKKHTNEIWELDLPPGAKLVFLALYWRQGPTGCHPSQEEISRMTGLSVRAIREHLKLLKKRGLLDIERLRHQTNPQHQVNRYTLRPTAVKDTVAGFTAMLEHRQKLPVITPAENDRNTGRKPSLTPADSAGNRKLIEKDRKRAVDNPTETTEKHKHRTSLTLAEYLHTARLAAATRKSGQAMKNDDKAAKETAPP